MTGCGGTTTISYKKNDILVAISASGNSMNLIKAIEFAKENEIKTVGITAFDGGKLKQVADYNIHVPTEKGEYGPAEDAHMILDHLMGSFLYRFVRLEARKESAPEQNNEQWKTAAIG